MQKFTAAVSAAERDALQKSGKTREKERESVSEREVVVFVYNNKKIVAEAVLLAASKRSHRMCVGFF